MPLTQENRDLVFASPLGDDVLLIRSMHLSEQLGRPFHAELELTSETFDIDFSQIVGQNVTVCYAGGAAPRYFNGYVSRFAQSAPQHRLASYTATVVPFLWFLTRNADCRIFQNMAVPDIIKQVFQDRGFTDVISQLNGTYGPWEYCVQYRETDFNFVSRLMEQEGIYYYFQHEDEKHSIVLVDDPAAHQPYPQYESIAYRPLTGDASGEFIHDWTIEQEVQPGTCSLNDFDFTAPRKSLLSASQVQRDNAGADCEIYDYPGEFIDPGDGSEYAKVRIQELQAQFETARGSSDAAGICTGFTFTMTDYPRDDQNREYLITSASYQLTSDDADGSRGGGGPVFNSHFVAIDAKTPFRAPRLTPKPIVQGPQTAIVVGPSGQEIYTDEYGRVKVQFFWDRYGQSNEKSSCWIRVAQVWAGKKWGGMFIPRIGQEVIVEFLEGDPDQPIITGRVYNAITQVPYNLPAHATMSTLKSDSSPGSQGFNELRFEDKKGSEQVFLHSQRRTDIYTIASTYISSGGNIETHVGGTNGGDKVTWVGGDTHVHLTKKLFEETELDATHVYNAVVNEAYAADRTAQIKGQDNLNNKAWQVVTEEAATVKAKSFTLDCSDTVSIRGGAVNIEGSTGGISLKVGGNFVVINTAGVSINGTMVNINSGGAATAADAAPSASPLDLLAPLDAYTAFTGLPGMGGHGGGGGRSQKKLHFDAMNPPKWKPPPPPPTKDIPPPPPPPPPGLSPDVKCGIVSITAKCSHNGRSASNGQVLFVVPDSDTQADNIDLSAEVQGGCGSHPQWEITGQSTVTGASQKLQAKAPVQLGSWLPSASPNAYAVACSACEGPSQSLEVRAYPPNKVSEELDLKKLSGAVKAIKEGIEITLETVVDKIEVDLPTGKISVEAQWKEWKDNRAFYGFRISVALDPLVGLSFEHDIGPLKLIDVVTKRIPRLGSYIQEFVDKCVEAKIFIKIEGKFAVRFEIDKSDPETPQFPSPKPGGGASGSLEVSLGLRGGFGGDCLRLEVSCTGALTADANATVSDEGLEIENKIAFEGLSGKISFVLAWGIVTINESVILIGSKDVYAGKYGPYFGSESESTESSDE